MIKYKDLGEIDYLDAWKYQEKIFDALIAEKTTSNKENENRAQQFILFCEHPHVYTIGKSGKENNLLINENFLEKINASCYRTNRGGDITYHGPGQIVGYPILDIERLNLSIKEYIFHLEKSIIETLKSFNIFADRLDGATGVWVNPEKAGTEKICAMGVRASRHITMHGFALNVNTDLSYFTHINPCGFTDKGVTSMEKELGEKQDINEVKSALIEKITGIFDIKLH